MTGMRDGPALKRTWKDTKLFEKLPDNLTYPNVTPKLIEQAKLYLKSV